MQRRARAVLGILAVTSAIAAGCGDSKPTAHAPSPAPGASASGTASSGSPTCTSGWKVAPKPSVDGADREQVFAASAVAFDDVWAVGTRFASPIQTVAIEHWDGHNWSDVAGGDVGGRPAALSGVVALKADDVWAVGRLEAVGGQSQAPLIEHWDGLQWSLVAPAPFPPSTPNGPQGLYDIAAVSANDIWTRGEDQPVSASGESLSRDVYEHWDGHQWSTFIGPDAIDPSEGSAATQSLAAHRSGEVWAVGGKIQGFGAAGQLAGAVAERWDGSAWQPMAVPTGMSALGSVAIAGPNDVWAVDGVGLAQGVVFNGEETQPTMFVHWDGTTWTSFTAADAITAIAVRTPNDVWAVGGGLAGPPRVQRWDGKEWNVTDTDAPDTVKGGLSSASTTAAGALVAFGGDFQNGTATSTQSAAPTPNNYLFIDCG